MTNQNEEEFARLVRENKSTIYSVCYMFTTDQDEVADLFQETLINLWKGFSSFRGESQPSTWIYRVTMNTCISYDRKRKSQGEKVALDGVDVMNEEDTVQSGQLQQLYRRIHSLPLVDRAIVMLWLENLSYDEIGQIVGISPKNVSVKLVRIKQQLKNQ